MNKKSILSILLLQSATLFLSGCAYYEPTLQTRHDSPGYMPEGPGLLSGEKGYYEIEMDR